MGMETLMLYSQKQNAFQQIQVRLVRQELHCSKMKTDLVVCILKKARSSLKS